MEVDGLGARCALSTCRTLDYLPFKCAQCSLSFCDDHKLPGDHSCTSQGARPKTVPVCPLCRAPVPVGANVTADIAVSRHIDQGCPKRHRTAPQCSHASCTVRDLSATTCPSCRKTFCLSHRLEADHNCTRVGARAGVDPFGNRVRTQKEAQPSKSKPQSRKGDGIRRIDFANTTATRIGDSKTDMEDRVNLAVFFPAGSGIQARHMYFSKRNSAGKIIDGLMKQFGVAKAPGAERYCLYVVKTDGRGVNLLPHISPLKDLPSGVVGNGDAVVMEVGEGGLDQAWMTVLRKAGGERVERPAHVRKGLGLKGRGSLRGRERSEKCAVA